MLVSRLLVLTMICPGVSRGTDTMLARTPSNGVRSRAVPSPGTSTIITWWFSSPPWSFEYRMCFESRVHEYPITPRSMSLVTGTASPPSMGRTHTLRRPSSGAIHESMVPSGDGLANARSGLSKNSESGMRRGCVMR